MRKIFWLTLSLSLIASVAFAGSKFGIAGTIVGKAGQYGRILVHAEIPTNPGCIGGFPVGSDGVRFATRTRNPITRRVETSMVWDHVYVGRGSATLVIIPGTIGIKSLTYQWADGRHEFVRFPRGTYSQEFGAQVIRREVHPRFYPEVLTITVEYINAVGGNAGTETYDITFMQDLGF